MTQTHFSSLPLLLGLLHEDDYSWMFSQEPNGKISSGAGMGTPAVGYICPVRPLYLAHAGKGRVQAQSDIAELLF